MAKKNGQGPATELLEDIARRGAAAKRLLDLEGVTIPEEGGIALDVSERLNLGRAEKIVFDDAHGDELGDLARRVFVPKMEEALEDYRRKLIEVALGGAA